MKKNLIVAVLLSALAVLTPRLWAGNIQDAISAQADMSAFSAVVAGGVGLSGMANLYYVGTSTEALVTINTASWTFYAPAGTIDTSIGASGVLTTASYGTMGTMCDAINASTNYRCVLTGAIRSDTPQTTISQQTATSGTCSLKSAGGCQLTNYSNTFIRYGILPQNGKRVVLTHVEVVSSASSDQVNVWGELRKWGGMTDNLGNTLVTTQNVWTQTTGGTSLVYIPARGQYQDFPWLDFKPNLTMSISASGVPSSPGNSYTGNSFGVIGNVYDGSVTVGLGQVSGTIQTSSQYLKVFWTEKGF